MKDTLIVNQKSAHTLGFFDPDKGQALKQLRLKDFPHEFVVDSQQRYMYVGHYGVENSGVIHDHGGCEIFVIDLETWEQVHTISTWPYYRIHGLAMDKQDRLYAMSESHSVLLMYENPRYATAPDRGVPSGGLKTHLFSLTKDGETAFGLNLLSHTVTRIKPWDPTYVPDVVSPGLKPEGNCLSADESVLFVTNRLDNQVVTLDTQTLQVTKRAETGIDPTRCYVSPTQQLWVTNYGGQSITVLTQSLETVNTIELAANPIAVSFHPSGQVAYVSMTNDQVATIDVGNLQVKGSFACLEEPDVTYLLQK